MRPIVVTLVCSTAFILSACASKNQPPSATTGRFDVHVYGPAEMNRAPGGYELKNRVVRAVIAEPGGNVSYWGRADGTSSVVFREGIAATIDSRPASASGYVEKRDDQTWQFIGEDADDFHWRKIYSLEGDNLYVTYIVQNRAKEAREVRIHVNGEFTGMRVLERTGANFVGRSAKGEVRMRAFNETADPFAPSLPVVLASDRRVLKPDERISFTTQWKLTLPDASRPRQFEARR